MDFIIYLFRESSPYQRSTNLKLSSFTSHANDSNDSQKQLKQALNAPCTSIGWSQRFPQPSNQQSSVQWLINPAYNKVLKIFFLTIAFFKIFTSNYIFIPNSKIFYSIF